MRRRTGQRHAPTSRTVADSDRPVQHHDGVLIGGIVIGLLLGLLVGGRLGNLASIQLRWTWLLLAAVVVRFGTEALLNAQVGVVETLRVPLLAGGFGILLFGLWVNRTYPGLSVAFIGILLNAIVIVANGGFMPIWSVSLEAAGFQPADVTGALHVVVTGEGAEFLTRALIIGDVIPVPIPVVRNVASLGDVFLSLGLAFFLFAGVVRVPTRLEEREEDAARDRSPQTGLAPGLREAAALQRPLVLGSQARRPRVAEPRDRWPRPPQPRRPTSTSAPRRRSRSRAPPRRRWNGSADTPMSGSP